MNRTLLAIASLLTLNAIGTAQVVRVDHATFANDVWGKYFSIGKKITFSGRVVGIGLAVPRGGTESEVTLTVKNSDGGGLAAVDLGPQSFVDNQSSKVRMHDHVQVTGSKVFVDGEGLVLASMIRVGAQGGPVLAMRRTSGQPYWQTPVVASNTPPTDQIDTEYTGQTNPTIINPPVIISPPGIIQGQNGLLNIDTNAGWYGPYNYDFNVGGNAQVVSGPYPMSFGTNIGSFPGQSMGGNNFMWFPHW